MPEYDVYYAARTVIIPLRSYIIALYKEYTLFFVEIYRAKNTCESS